MLSFFVRRGLDAFAKRYDYDVDYMLELFEVSPKAFFKYSRLTAVSQHNEAAPKDALYAAKLIGAMHEDCGPCTQLVVNMALEAGVGREQVEAVLRRDLSAMSDAAALAFRFADAVVQRRPEEDELRAEVHRQWGGKGVVDLTFALQFSRMYPMIKAGLGYAKECRRVTVGGKSVDVVKQVA